MTIINQPTTVSDLAERWLRFLDEDRNLSPATTRMYSSTLKAFCKSFDDLEVLTADDVHEWVRRPRGKKGSVRPAPATRKRDLMTLKHFFRWVFAHEYADIRLQELLVMPHVDEGQPRPVPDALWLHLWNSQMALDDRVWLGLAYFLGLRRSEIVTMSPDVVDPDRGMLINFRRKGGKTKVMEYRAVCLLQQSVLPHVTPRIFEWMHLMEDIAVSRRGEKHLSVFSESDDQFLDGNRLTKRLANVLLPNAGMARDSFTPHQLRHSCATNLWRAGMSPDDIRRHMSHSAIRTTEGYMDTSGYMERIIKERGIDDGNAKRPAD
jgi:site-specific recombinase XerD